MQPRGAGSIFAHDLDRAAAHLADLAHHHDVVILVGQLAQLLQKAEVLGARLVVDIVLHPVEIGRHDLRLGLCGRVRAQLLVVEVVVHRIEAEPVQPAIQPELAGLQNGIDHVRVVKVQIGLRGKEVMQVILSALGVELPRGATEMAVPVGWR